LSFIYPETEKYPNLYVNRKKKDATIRKIFLYLAPERVAEGRENEYLPGRRGFTLRKYRSGISIMASFEVAYFLYFEFRFIFSTTSQSLLRIGRLV
jgi:hypothetical protein